MKLYSILLLVVSSLSVNAMNVEDKKSSGVDKSTTKNHLATLTIYDCPPGCNPSFFLERIVASREGSLRIKHEVAFVPSKSNSPRGHMNF